MLLLLTLCLLGLGCTSDEEPRAGERGQSGRGGSDVASTARGSAGVDGPLMYAAEPEGGGGSEAAIVEGTLVLERNCLYLSTTGADSTPPGHVVLWPHGTHWDAGSNSVQLHDGTVLEPGDLLTAGGGYYGPDGLPLSDQSVVAKAKSCGAVEGDDVAFPQSDIREAPPAR